MCVCVCVCLSVTMLAATYLVLRQKQGVLGFFMAFSRFATCGFCWLLLRMLCSKVLGSFAGCGTRGTAVYGI